MRRQPSLISEAVPDDASRRRAVECSEQVQQRRLAAPGFARHGHELAGRDLEFDPAEHLRAPRVRDLQPQRLGWLAELILDALLLRHGWSSTGVKDWM